MRWLTPQYGLAQAAAILTAEGSEELLALHAAIAAATGRHEADMDYCRH